MKEMFLPDRYIKGECPNCGAKDQYGDSCESVRRDLQPDRPQESRTRRCPAPRRCGSHRSITSSSSRTRCEDVSPGMDRARARCSPRPPTSEGMAGQGREAHRLGHLARRRPTSASRFPAHPARSTSTSGSTPRSVTSRSFSNYCDKQRRRQAVDFDAIPCEHGSETEMIHFIGKDILYFHALFWPAMLEILRATGRRTTSTCTASLTCRRREDVQVARHLHRPRSATSSTA